MLNYKEFRDYIEKNILDEFNDKENKTVEIKEVAKNNDTKKYAIIIESKNDLISPIVYLESFYQQYTNGIFIKKIMRDIAYISRYDTLKISYENSFEKDILSTDRIVGLLANKKKNKDYLKDTVKINVGKNLVIYFCYILESDSEMNTIKITNHIAEHFHYSEKQLLDFAMNNTPKLFPVCLCPMTEMIENIKKETIQIENLEIKESIFDEELKMLIITNNQKINGSFSLFYPGLLDILSNIYEKDMIAIPSSIHEWIMLSYEEDLDLDEIKNMITETNETCVMDEDFLDDTYYIIKNNGKSILEQFLETK